MVEKTMRICNSKQKTKMNAGLWITPTNHTGCVYVSFLFTNLLHKYNFCRKWPNLKLNQCSNNMQTIKVTKNDKVILSFQSNNKHICFLTNNFHYQSFEMPQYLTKIKSISTWPIRWNIHAHSRSMHVSLICCIPRHRSIKMPPIYNDM